MSLVKCMSCPACDKVLPGAHRRCDGVLHNLCFVPVSAVGEENLCGLMLVMGKYCITVFNYAPLCRTEWRLMGGFISHRLRVSCSKCVCFFTQSRVTNRLYFKVCL